MKIAEILNETSLFGPIYHRTNSNIDSFSQYDLSQSSNTTPFAPAIYATFGDANLWTPNHLKGGKVLKGYVSGKIYDATQPATPEALAQFSRMLGRELDHIPYVSLEKRFGSLAKAFQLAGYAAVIHMGPGRPDKHIAVFDSASIVDAGSVM